VPLGGREEEKEPAAAGAQELASEGAVSQAGAVQLVDLRGGHAGVERPLGEPCLVQQLTELAQRTAAGENVPPLVDHRAHALEGTAVVTRARQLPRDHVGGLAGDAGEHDEQMMLEFAQALGRHRDPVYHQIVFPAELDHVEAASAAIAWS